MKKLKIYIIFSVFMVSLLPFLTNIKSVATLDVWDGITSDKSWYQEDKDSFEINSAAQLKGLADLVNDDLHRFENKTVYLTKDIDLNNYEWTPIGKMWQKSGEGNYALFSGNFDGNSHTISNMRISDQYINEIQASGYVSVTIGFFGQISNGSIQNLKLRNANIDNNVAYYSDYGLLAGTIADSDVYNCSVEGNIHVEKAEWVGGLSGNLVVNPPGTSNIKENYADVNISGSADIAGGLFGLVSAYYSQPIDIIDNYAKGTISMTADFIGGFMAVATNWMKNDTIVIQHAYADVLIKSESTTAQSIANFGYTQGGIIIDNVYWNDDNPATYGINDNGAMITNSSGKTLEELKTQQFVDVLNAGRKDIWYKQNNDTPTFVLSEIEYADYSKVEAAIENVPTDLSVYTDCSVRPLQKALDQIEWDKLKAEQPIVDGYALAIERAIHCLVYKKADYSSVKDAIEQIPEDLSIYTDASVQKLKAAKKAVEWNKNISEQALVDEYAQNILDAIASLQKKESTNDKPEGTPNEKPDENQNDKGNHKDDVSTNDTSNHSYYIILVLLAISGIVYILKKKSIDEE